MTIEEKAYDEAIRKELIQFIKNWKDPNNIGRPHDFPTLTRNAEQCDRYIAWLEKQKHLYETTKDRFYLEGFEEGQLYEKQKEQKPIDKIQLGKRYKCIASPRYSTFMVGEIYEPKDKFLCSLMNFCSDCFESIEDKEQKPNDKVEPKFKVGDWVVQEKIGVYKVIEICESWYEVVDNKDKHYSIGFDKEYMCHLWTVKDAKDGDVLVLNNEIFVYAHRKQMYPIAVAQCFVDSAGGFHLDGEFGYVEHGGTISPATKEQSDTLIKAMDDAGYTFDFEKKELKKIEQKSTEWSEEDESILQGIWDEILANKHNSKEYEWKAYDKFLDWLKSLKDRVQPKQEWSEEDIRNIDVIDTVLFYDKDLPENTCVRLRNWLESLKPQNNITDEELVQAKKDAYNDALDKIEYHSGEPTFDDGWSAAIDYIRKKYLRPQQQWKPTEAQLSSLTIACDRNDRVGFDLTQLLRELKKL